MKDLELNFDSDGFYFLNGAKVKVTSAFNDSLECNLTPSPKPTYTLSDKTLTITGLWSVYSMKYFSFKHKTEANSGISFTEGESNKMKSVNLYKDGADTTIISSSTAPMTNDNKYIITIDSSGDGKCADSIVIEFEAVPTIADGTQIEYAQGSTDGILVDLTAATGSSPSLFGGFFSRVSSGVSSVFGGARSMSHEELMAQKEAKAAKARARAAEKAAKKAAKAAKKSSAKSDSVAESKAWGGLSSGFESSSAELDAAVSQLKSSELSNTSALGSQKKAAAKKVRVVSKNSSAIEVAALASETASEPEISSINIEETEQGGSKMILVIGGILASLGAAGGIFLKKSRKS